MKAQASLHGSRLDPMQSSFALLSQSAPIQLPFEPGEVIAGKYEMIGLIGSGGMGYVVSARHIELGELVAIKFLRAEALAYDELVGRFAREARASVRIKSEHVARVYDVGNLPNGIPFIVMEHLEGKDLGDVLQAHGRLPIKIAVEYVMQACEALASAHAVGTIHRDVKPENLFLARQAQGVDVVKVLDFGISKVALSGAMAAAGPRQFVRTTMPIGSPVYMSPEQIRSSENVDVRTDIWSMGCVLFELLTGATAFDAPTLMELGAVILGSDPVTLRTLLPEAPEELEQIVLKCLHKDPSKRFQHIAELGIALYPFGPRRARISAERCHSLLKGTDSPAADIELASIAPPNSVTSTALRAFPTLATNAMKSSGPMSVGGIEVTPPPGARKSRRGAVLIVAAAAVSAVVFALWPKLSSTLLGRASTASQTTTALSPETQAADKAREAPGVALPAAKVAVVPKENSEPSTAQPEAAPRGEAPDVKAGQPAEAKARHRYRPPPTVRLVPTPQAPAEKPKGAPRSLSDEPDVGF